MNKRDLIKINVNEHFLLAIKDTKIIVGTEEKLFNSEKNKEFEKQTFFPYVFKAEELAWNYCFSSNIFDLMVFKGIEIPPSLRQDFVYGYFVVNEKDMLEQLKLSDLVLSEAAIKKIRSSQKFKWNKQQNKNIKIL